MSGVHTFHPTVVLHGNNTALVSDLSGQFAAEELQALCGLGGLVERELRGA